MRRMLLRASEGAISGIVAAGIVEVALAAVERTKKRRRTPMQIFLGELRRVMRGAPLDEDRRRGVPWVLARAAGRGAVFGALGLGKHFPVVSGLGYGSLLWVLERRHSMRVAIADLTYGVTLALGTKTLYRATRKLGLA